MNFSIFQPRGRDDYDDDELEALGEGDQCPCCAYCGFDAGEGAFWCEICEDAICVTCAPAANTQHDTPMGDTLMRPDATADQL